MPRCFALLCVVSFASFAGAAEDPARKFQAGAATSNITPPLGGAIVGGFLPAPAKHIHDELHARCLVLDDGQTRLALVVCDLLGIHHQVSTEARKLIAEQSKIPADRVLISATHTHSATSALGQDRFKLDAPLDDYQLFVARRIADGVQRAANQLRPAQIAFGTVDAPEHVFNRRWSMRPGTVPENPFGGVDRVKMNPGVKNPNLVEPAGPTDPTVSFIALREPGGKPISVFSAYSLHYVGDVGPAHISADYFGMYCEELKRLLGAQEQDPPFVGLMANGTSGDVNNVNFREGREAKPTYGQMRYVAHDVAAKVHGALGKLEYRDHVTLAALYREAEVGWRRPTAEELAWAKSKMPEETSLAGRANLPRIYAERVLKMADYPATAQLPVQVFRIGDVCLATMPCEVFCEIGLEFRRRCPLPSGFMVSLNHGYYGYLPTPRHHDLGGYETWLGTNRLERTASDKLLAKLLEMAGELKAAR
jgi:neutral ceramidase